MRLLFSILLFLGGIALIFWAGKPLWKEISALRVERGGVFNTLSELRGLQKARDDLLATYNSISKSDLKKLDQILPQNSDTGGVLVSLEKISQDRGVRLRKAEFKTNEDTKVKAIQAPNQMFNTIDLSFIVSSNYDSFKSFLDALQRNSRIIDVTNISFSVGQTNFYEFIVQANAYYAKSAIKIAGLRDIEGVQIDTSLFSNPRFVELESTPTPPTDIKKGRINPFVQI